MSVTKMSITKVSFTVKQEFPSHRNMDADVTNDICTTNYVSNNINYN